MVAIRRGELEVRQIANPFKQSNTYVLSCHGYGSIWLVDPGDSPYIGDVLRGHELQGIFITHAHFDHIRGLAELLRIYPDCAVYASPIGIDCLCNDRRNLSFYYEQPLSLSNLNSRPLSDGEKLEIGNDITVECIHTPGHTPDSACYRIAGLLFTGDAYIPGIPTVTKLRGGSKVDSERSIEIIKTLISKGDMVLPGHGPVDIG